MFHRPIVEASAEVLRSVFEDDRYADKSIEYAFRNNKKWGARDRKFVAETVFESVRWWRKLLYLSNQSDSERVDYTKIVAAYWVLRGSELPDWMQTRDFDKSAVEKKMSEVNSEIRLRESVPDWLNDVGSQELGEVWEDALKNLNNEAPVFLRVNKLKTTSSDLIGSLSKEDIVAKVVEGVDGALILEKRANVFKTEAFKKGHFEVQDLSSQQVAPFMGIKPGDFVVDACAGAGGKSLHIGNEMKNKGKLIALDIHEHKLKELRKRSSRNGIDVIECRPISSSKVIKRLHGKADHLLLDVPCSGLGVLRRNPDTKWKCSVEEINRLKSLQLELLETYSKIVKPGGDMTYATCSILPSENRGRVDLFLNSEAGQDFQLVEDKSILPSENGGDGFYMARLKKKGE